MGSRTATTMPHLLIASAHTSVTAISSLYFDVVGPQESWESPVSIRGPCSKYYYVLLVFMSIYLLSLTYFTKDRVCYMQGIFALPPWTDQGAVATKFRQWFNYVANKRWSDNKNRSLRRIYESLG